MEISTYPKNGKIILDNILVMMRDLPKSSSFRAI